MKKEFQIKFTKVSKLCFVTACLLSYHVGIAQFPQKDAVVKPNSKIFNPQKVAAARAKIANPQWSFVLPKDLQFSNEQAVLSFRKNRPTVVVLIHGITGYPETDPTTNTGTLKGARFQWGPDFIYNLFGVTEDKPTTFTDDNTLSGSLFSGNWESKNTNNNVISDHFVTVYGKPTPNYYPPFSLMFTYRDGSESYRNQVSKTAAQIVYLYNGMFGNWPKEKQPQLILLCHSFGGVVARTICSVPNSIPSNDNGIATELFSANDKTNMEFIRNKTMYITTLSTPHEGSPITFSAALGSYLQHIPLIGETFDEQDPDAGIIKQLSSSFMANINQTILSPDKCKRKDGTLIPIHALGGRSPGGPTYYFDPTKNKGGISNTNQSETLQTNRENRDKYESYGLMRADYAVHLVDVSLEKKPWGKTPSDNLALDIIQAREKNIVTGCISNVVYDLVEFGVDPTIFYLRKDWNEKKVGPFCISSESVNNAIVRDGEIDADGFVPINSALGVKLGTDTKNYFEHTNNGSWYRFYTSKADFHNHGSIKQYGEIGKWLREEIIHCFTTSLLFGQLGNNSAGPNVSVLGNKSVW